MLNKDHARRFHKGCEYRPDCKRPAYPNEVHAPARYMLGEGDWFLCEDCANLPEFKDFRKVVFKVGKRTPAEAGPTGGNKFPEWAELPDTPSTDQE